MSWCCVQASTLTMHYDLSLQEQRSTTWTELKNSDRDLSIYFRSWLTSIAESNRELVYPASIQAWAEKHSSSVVILQVLLTWIKRKITIHSPFPNYPIRHTDFHQVDSRNWQFWQSEREREKAMLRKNQKPKKKRPKQEESDITQRVDHSSAYWLR